MPMKNICFLSFLFAMAIVARVEAQKAERGTYPSPGPVRPLTLPEIQAFRLDNGLPVYLVEKRDLPIVQMTFVFNAGSIYDPAALPGLAAMAADLLDEGAGDRNALSFSEEIDFLGISLGAVAARDRMSLSLFSPSARLEQALPLLGDMLLRPRFDAGELERKRTEGLVRIKQSYDEARIIASTAFNQVVFGKDHPYARPANGTEASIKAVQSADLHHFHSTYIHPGNGFLVIAGDMDRMQAERLLGTLLRDWKAGALKPFAVPDPPQAKGFQIFLIDKPGAAQSELRFGHPGLSRNTPDYFPVQVMNTILGASFTSRLNTNIREVHGYAYGASSSFNMPKGKGAFLGASAVQSDATDKAVAEFVKEFNAIRTVQEQEAEKARNYLALGFPGEFESIENIAAQVADVLFFNLPENYLNAYIGEVLKVGKGDIERVAKAYIDSKNMVLVVVGDQAKIEPGLRALKLGKINYLKVEDVLGPLPK